MAVIQRRKYELVIRDSRSLGAKNHEQSRTKTSRDELNSRLKSHSCGVFASLKDQRNRFAVTKVCFSCTMEALFLHKENLVGNLLQCVTLIAGQMRRGQTFSRAFRNARRFFSALNAGKMSSHSRSVCRVCCLPVQVLHGRCLLNDAH